MQLSITARQLENTLTKASERPLRIALLGYRSHPHVGGQGIYLKHLSKALTQLGHRVDVLSGPPYPELDDGINLVKIPSLDLYAVFPHHIKAFRWRFLRSWADFIEWFSMASGGFAEPYSFSLRVQNFLLSHREYDLIHDNQSLGYGLLKIQKKVAPLVATVHHPITRDLAISLQQEPRWAHRLLLKRWYSFLKMQIKVARKIPNLLTVSSSSKSDIIAAFGCKKESICVIPNGIDVDTFKPRPQIAPHYGRIISTASSDQPLKGLKSLLQALHEARKTNPALHLRIIGKLKPNGATDKLIHTLNLREAVSFRNQISDDELCQEYAKAQLAVCPSLYEGFGLPALEALACGTPLLSSDGGALPEVVGDAGVIYPAGDAQMLAKKIIQFIDNPEILSDMAKAGRDRAVHHFSWIEVAKQLTHYYHNILNLSQCKP